MAEQRNDSLIELLIVIALILIMAATAVPNLLRAARADRESFAVSPSTAGTGPSPKSPQR